MKINIQPIKTTILGGLVFLVPCIVVILILAKAFEIMAKLAAPFGAWIPVDSIGGIATANVITVLALLIVCFVAGRIATSGLGRRFHQSLDNKLLVLFPRYAFIRSMTESMSADEVKKTFQPVRVNFNDLSQIAFEVERDDQGLVTVFLPGSPDPWTGSVVHVTVDRVEVINANFNAIMDSLRKAGKDASVLLR